MNNENGLMGLEGVGGVMAGVTETLNKKAIDVVSSEDRLLEKVLDSGNIDVLERFIALREREEARQSKRLFDEQFAIMQSNFVAVGRSKEGYGYKYAPIEVLQKAYGPIIAEHGFSYRWREENIEKGKRCTLIISGYGHSEENSFDIPTLDGTKQMNPIQIAGAMSTYGRRYTFISGFGVIIHDEDNDGRVITEEEKTEWNSLSDLAKLAKLSQREITDLEKRFQNASGSPRAKKNFITSMTTELNEMIKRISGDVLHEAPNENI